MTTATLNNDTREGTREGAIIELLMIEGERREQLARGIVAMLPRGHKSIALGAAGELDADKWGLESARTSRTASMRTLLAAARKYYASVARLEDAVWGAFWKLAAEANKLATHEVEAAVDGGAPEVMEETEL